MKKTAVMIVSFLITGAAYAASGCCTASAAAPTGLDTKVSIPETSEVKAKPAATVKAVSEKPVAVAKSEKTAVKKVAVANTESCPVAGKCTTATTCGDKAQKSCESKCEAECSVRTAVVAAEDGKDS